MSSFRPLRSVNTAVGLNVVLDDVAVTYGNVQLNVVIEVVDVVAVTYGNVELNILLDNVSVVTLTYDNVELNILIDNVSVVTLTYDNVELNVVLDDVAVIVVVVVAVIQDNVELKYSLHKSLFVLVNQLLFNIRRRFLLLFLPLYITVYY